MTIIYINLLIALYSFGAFAVCMFKSNTLLIVLKKENLRLMQPEGMMKHETTVIIIMALMTTKQALIWFSDLVRVMQHLPYASNAIMLIAIVYHICTALVATLTLKLSIFKKRAK